jgi:hypothetical protein
MGLGKKLVLSPFSTCTSQILGFSAHSSCDTHVLSFQIVWATTNKIGCAVNTCQRINVWGDVWENAVYLVCNYSPK